MRYKFECLSNPERYIIIIYFDPTQLILMKKTIAQAKVCVISKLVKKLRETKKKLDAADDAPKPLNLIARPAKLNDQISHLKRTGNVDLARQCLVYDQKPHQVLTNPSASNEDVALAQLVTFKTVAERVAEIKSKYNLDTIAEDWRTAIAETGKKKQKRNVKEAHLKRKSEQKARETREKDAETKRKEWIVENGNESESNDAEPIANDSDEEMPSDGDDSGDSDCIEPEDVDNNATEAAVKSQKANTKKDVRLKTDSVANAKPVKKLPSLPAPSTKPFVPHAPRQLDSFFVTANGSAYMASGIERRHQPLGPNDGMDRRERRAQQFGGNAPNRKKPPPTMQYKKPLMQTQISSTAAADVSQLHPSWAAKQRTKGIASFQGSKKTFGDDDDDNSNNQPPPPRLTSDRSAQHSHRNGNSAVVAADDTAKLHPSWVAKQKLKPVITSFQGTKIKFGD